MAVSFQGFHETAATFDVSGTISEGAPVKLCGNGKVSACAAGESFCGVALAVREGFATVQLGGYALLSYSGTAPTVGYNALAADGKGGVKVLEGGRSLLVVEVLSDGTVGVML